jgi:cellulose synthase/poly-beta-1,6-N-acetylglucosamine synthase-like glycosyltransferase
MNSFLFSQPELEDRESRRFTCVRQEYLQLK